MRPLIVANWKMNPDSLGRAVFLAKEIERDLAKVKNVKVVIAPPFPFLFPVGKVLKKARLGAQNMFWGDTGAYTGEVSWHQLRSLRVEYVIIGHSERRRLFGDTDETVNKKIKAALGAKLKPIMCVANLAQLKNSLRGISQEIIIAFEPFSAIGTGKPYSVEKAREMRKKIKHPFVLYGGSVNSQNASDYIKKAGFQGLLLGGASLKPKEFIQIVKNITNK